MSTIEFTADDASGVINEVLNVDLLEGQVKAEVISAIVSIYDEKAVVMHLLGRIALRDNKLSKAQCLEMASKIIYIGALTSCFTAAATKAVVKLPPKLLKEWNNVSWAFTAKQLSLLPRSERANALTIGRCATMAPSVPLTIYSQATGRPAQVAVLGGEKESWVLGTTLPSYLASREASNDTGRLILFLAAWSSMEWSQKLTKSSDADTPEKKAKVRARTIAALSAQLAGRAQAQDATIEAALGSLAGLFNPFAADLDPVLLGVDTSFNKWVGSQRPDGAPTLRSSAGAIPESTSSTSSAS